MQNNFICQLVQLKMRFILLIERIGFDVVYQLHLKTLFGSCTYIVPYNKIIFAWLYYINEFGFLNNLLTSVALEAFQQLV